MMKSKIEIIEIMIDRFNKENIQLGIQGGATEEEIVEKTKEGAIAINFLLEKVYEELDSEGLIVK